MLLASLSGAHAADWFTIAATEEGRPDEPVKLFGLVSPRASSKRPPSRPMPLSMNWLPRTVTMPWAAVWLLERTQLSTQPLMRG